MERIEGVGRMRSVVEWKARIGWRRGPEAEEDRGRRRMRRPIWEGRGSWRLDGGGIWEK